MARVGLNVSTELSICDVCDAGTVNPDTQHPEFRQTAGHQEVKGNRRRLKTNAVFGEVASVKLYGG